MSQISDTAVINAEGGLVELGYAELTSAYTTTSASSTNTTPFIGPITIVSDGSPIVVEFSAPSCNNSNAAGAQVVTNLIVDGVVTGYLCGNYSGNSNTPQAIPYGGKRRLTLSAGTHTIACSAWHGGAAGTINMGNGNGGNWSPGLLRVSKIVTASEWPAINEQNRIICTSSTRPSAPYEGIEIYETDTGLIRYYDGTAWEDTAAATRPYHAEVYLNADISYPRATALQWTHTRYDNTGGAWASSPNPERLVFPADGMYLCVANMQWDVGSGNDSTQTGLNVNGGLGYVTNVGYAVNTTEVKEILTTVAVVSAGDYLTVASFNKPTGGSPFTCRAGSFLSFTQLSAVPT